MFTFFVASNLNSQTETNALLRFIISITQPQLLSPTCHSLNKQDPIPQIWSFPNEKRGIAFYTTARASSCHYLCHQPTLSPYDLISTNYLVHILVTYACLQYAVQNSICQPLSAPSQHRLHTPPHSIPPCTKCNTRRIEDTTTTDDHSPVILDRRRINPKKHTSLIPEEKCISC